jgi:hypothetical protein
MKLAGALGVLLVLSGNSPSAAGDLPLPSPDGGLTRPYRVGTVWHPLPKADCAESKLCTTLEREEQFQVGALTKLGSRQSDGNHEFCVPNEAMPLLGKVTQSRLGTSKITTDNRTLADLLEKMVDAPIAAELANHLSSISAVQVVRNLAKPPSEKFAKAARRECAQKVSQGAVVLLTVTGKIQIVLRGNNNYPLEIQIGKNSFEKIRGSEAAAVTYRSRSIYVLGFSTASMD